MEYDTHGDIVAGTDGDIVEGVVVCDFCPCFAYHVAFEGPSPECNLEYDTHEVSLPLPKGPIGTSYVSFDCGLDSVLYFDGKYKPARITLIAKNNKLCLLHPNDNRGRDSEILR